MPLSGFACVGVPADRSSIRLQASVEFDIGEFASSRESKFDTGVDPHDPLNSMEIVAPGNRQSVYLLQLQSFQPHRRSIWLTCCLNWNHEPRIPSRLGIVTDGSIIQTNLARCGITLHIGNRCGKLYAIQLFIHRACVVICLGFRGTEFPGVLALPVIIRPPRISRSHKLGIDIDVASAAGWRYED